MKTCTLLCILSLINLKSFSQAKLVTDANNITREGLKIFYSEKTSWLATDIILKKLNESDSIRGYISYANKDSFYCTFYNFRSPSKVIGTIAFDSTFKISKASINLKQRDFNNVEIPYYKLREAAISLVSKDTFFTKYKNCNINFIPIISQQEKKVYIRTDPNDNTYILFGNDYILNFNSENQLISKRKLHKNLIPIESKPKTGVESNHTHLDGSSDYMTPTDICTLLLYENKTNWSNHTVISKEYTSTWFCQKDTLIILPNSILIDAANDLKERNKLKR